MRAVRLAIGLALLAGAASAEEPELPALRIPLDRLHAEVKTLCVQPLVSEVQTDEWPTRRAFVEQFLASELGRAGFAVVPAEKFAALRDQVSKQGGGVFDPLTGVRDRKKIEAVREATLRRAFAELGCQALVEPSIEFGTTAFNDIHAIWDHVDHDLGKSWGMYGWVGVLSLHLEIAAPDGRLLFERWAGIHPVSLWKNGHFESLTRAELLAHRGWNARAVLVGLGELAQPPDEELVPCLREVFSRTRAKDRPTVGSRYLLNWAVTHSKGIETRGICEAARFAFVPPPPAPEPEAQADAPQSPAVPSEPIGQPQAPGEGGANAPAEAGAH